MYLPYDLWNQGTKKQNGLEYLDTFMYIQVKNEKFVTYKVTNEDIE